MIVHVYAVAIAFTIHLVHFVWRASRSMAGMQHGRYRMHFDTLGRKRPCYQDQCGCAWQDNEMEDAA